MKKTKKPVRNWEFVLKDGKTERLLFSFNEKQLDLKDMEITIKSPDEWKEFSKAKFLYFRSGSVFYKTLIPSDGDSVVSLRKSTSTQNYSNTLNGMFY